MSILVWYLVLFAPQLVIGAAIGWWAALRGGQAPHDAGASAEASARRERELRLALSRLKLLTDSVQEDVREHAQKVDSSSKELADLSANGQSPDADSAMEAIVPIVKANEELQRRLQETERKLAEQSEQLDKQTTEARTDPLTGLLNRRGMEIELTQLFEDYKQAGRNFCLTILDIDHFKQFNDEYGHDIGDMVLCEVARVVSGAVRRQDIVTRFGGEEFVILSPATEVHEAGELLERVRLAVEQNVVRDEAGDLMVTVSLGVAQVSAEDAAALMKRADVALYAAKEAGRNRAYFHDGLHPQPIARRQASPRNARSDEFTELPSRTEFTEEVDRRIAESARNHGDVSLVVLEIDQLAGITGQHGEQTANLVRRGVAAFLQDIMRGTDLVARNGEDSFCILLPGCPLDDAARVAERVRRAASQTPFQTGEDEIRLTLSAGVTSAVHGESAASMMERGQNALEAALRSGGDSSTVERPQEKQAADEPGTMAEAQRDEAVEEPVAVS